MIKAHYERKLRILTAKPAAAWSAGTAVGRLRGAVACEVTAGAHVVRTDGPREEGGDESAPTPAALVRAGLVACLVVGYKLWAARRDVVLDEVEVEMTCELDARGQLGVAGVPPRWQRISWTARITSDAPEEVIERLVAEADRLSPMLDSLDKSIVLERALVVRRRGDA